MQIIVELIDKLIVVLNKKIHYVEKIIEKNDIYKKLMIFLMVMFFVILPLTIKFIPFLIIAETWIITIVLMLVYISEFVKYLILYLLAFTSILITWIAKYGKRVIKIVISIMIVVIAFLILISMSLVIGLAIKSSIYGGDVQLINLSDEFIPDLITMGISLVVMFLLSLLFHGVFYIFQSDEWYYKTVNGLLVFISSILFVFILGIGGDIVDYLVLNVESIVSAEEILLYDLKQVEFHFKRVTNLGLYGLFASVIAYQTTFNIVYQKEWLTKINDANIINKFLKNIKDKAKKSE